MGNSNRTQPRSALASASSLIDLSEARVAGGGGEFKLGSESSNHSFWGDDESTCTIPNSAVRPKNICRKCKEEIHTKAKYCRQCYQSRDDWMPLYPNRKKKLDNQVTVPSKDLSRSPILKPSINPPFNRRLLSVNTRETTLPRRVEQILLQDSSSTIFNYDHLKRRQEERRMRREHARQGRKLPRESLTDSDNDEQGDESSADLCIVCGIRPPDTLVIHGGTAHQCMCRFCSLHYSEKNLGCPQCGQQIENIWETFRD